MMTGSTADRNPFERLAEDFAERLRRGEHPAITDYIARHPEHADDIRDLFPEIAAVEQCKPSDGESRTSSSTAIPVRPGRLPDQLGDYRILRYLGAGGMGVVYEAVRESLRNNVALKVMHPQFRDREQYARRFRIEARSAARLHHTNIVSVFDYGVHDGVCYYAMQYIAGHSLDKILADVRQLRREKEVLTAGEAAATASETQAPTRSEPWLTPSQPGEAPTCASSRALSLGLMTGEWSATASTRGSDDGEAQPEPATTVAIEKRGIAGPPEDDAENGVPRTALRMLAAELAGSDDDRTLAPWAGGRSRRRAKLRAGGALRLKQLSHGAGRGALLSRDRPARRSGRRRARPCPQAGRAPSRYQAVEPDPRRAGKHLDHRLRTGQVRGRG